MAKYRMRLDHATWLEVDEYLLSSRGIIIPVGSTEQHGPMGLIGTDALCAELIAMGAAQQADAYLAPTLAYTPAPFNMAFPGTISISEQTFQQLVSDNQSPAVAGFRNYLLFKRAWCKFETAGATYKQIQT
jgi:creatinine amidohydrolase